MSSNGSATGVDIFELDPVALGRAGINAVRVAFGLVGIVAVGLGIALLVWPHQTLKVGAAILGIYFIVSGIVRLALGIFTRGLSAGHRVLELVLGLFVLLAGIIVVRNLSASAGVLLLIAVLALGFAWIIEGVLAIVESGRSGSGGLGIAFGIISILAGILVLVWPGLTALAFAILVGVLLVILGITGIARAFTFGKNLKVS